MRGVRVLGPGAVGAAAAIAALGGWACETVDLGSPPADINACRPDPQFFYDRVWPEYLGREVSGKRCNDSGCHDSGSPRQLRIPAPTSTPSLPLPADWAAAYKSVTEQMSCTNVSSSPLVDRPSRLDHGGGKLIEPDGPEVELIRMWVEAR
jgi:hypothetical protein